MANRKTPEGSLLHRARSIFEGWSPELRGYVALGVGLSLFLFSMGYFQFLNIVIGALGLILLIWGTFTSQILDKLKELFESIKKRFK